MNYYAIGLLALFYVFLIGEFFVPSAGLIGVAAVVCGSGAIICGFAHSTFLGMTLLLTVVASAPAVLIFMIRLWPHTPIGRRILNRRPGQTDDFAPVSTTRDGTPLDDLVGQIGVAKTDLLPSGLIEIGGKRIDAVTTGAAIDAGNHVVVTKTEAGKVHVKMASEKDLASAKGSQTAAESKSDSDPIAPEEPPTSPELKSFDLDSLD